MKRLITSSTERTVFRVLGAVAIIAVAILTWGYFNTQKEQDAHQAQLNAQQEKLLEQDNKIANAIIVNCETNRKLISDIALRTVGSTYAQYKKDPQAAIDKYRSQLIQIELYRNSPELLDQVIERTAQTLRDADPASCKKTIEKAGVDSP